MATAPSAAVHAIHQSVVRWPFENIQLDQFCQDIAEIGYEGVDIIPAEQFEIPQRYGLRCTMGLMGLGNNKEIGLNRLEYHDGFVEAFTKTAPQAVKAGVRSAVTFSGLRAPDLTDEQGAKNCVVGLKRLAPIAADHGITICLEPQNSKRDHPGYMCDRLSWALSVCEEVGSENVKLLYDIYHMQIMEGDVITSIRNNIKWFHHYHTAGVPGRHNIDSTQELNWPAIMRAIADTGYQGHVAHEFVPLGSSMDELRQAYKICNI